jgi:glyoxylase-like metal-dependent hydrolase (beta-lactamase superfamily II)
LAIEVARKLLDRCLRDIGYGFGDIRRFLVTHVHRDHYTLASVLGHEHGADVELGLGDKPSLDLLDDESARSASTFVEVLRHAGAGELAEEWAAQPREAPDPAWWRQPTRWLDGDQVLEVGQRSLDAVHTPGHTPGHFVFADRAAGLLFAGDHVLPTITPSIGFTLPPAPHPLGDFMASLTRVRSLPDLTVLPAHGPVAPSSHSRVDELLRHHEDRLALSLAALESGPLTAHDVARRLPWTRHDHPFDGLDRFARGLATMETKAHLDLLVAQGRATTELSDGVVSYAGVRTGTP